MSNVALDPSLWEELTSNQPLDNEDPAAADELDPSRGIIWWGFASLVFWLLLVPAVL